jgi:hypothetical protein
VPTRGAQSVLEPPEPPGVLTAGARLAPVGAEFRHENGQLVVEHHQHVYRCDIHTTAVRNSYSRAGILRILSASFVDRFRYI